MIEVGQRVRVTFPVARDDLPDGAEQAENGEVIMVQVNENQGIARAMVRWDSDDSSSWVDLDRASSIE